MVVNAAHSAVQSSTEYLPPLLDKGAFAARKQVMLVREPAPLYPPLASSSAHVPPPDRCAIRSRAGILRHHGRISHHQGCGGQLATLKERLAEAEQLAYERAQKVIYYLERAD